ncbi:feruloyl-CoA synthase [Rhodobacteraceae bacterium M382]|nr:feruloyl-CoA synthase [Rhodobacteraceae bacterium M382]
MARPKYRTQKVSRQNRADGSILLRSEYALSPTANSTNDWLEQWAHSRPDAVFLAERSGAGWRELRYGAALEQVRSLAGGLLARGLTAKTPILILSGNGIDHALVTLAAHYVGIPTVPVAEQYSLIPGADSQLSYITDLIDPALVFAVDGQTFAKSLALDVMEGRDLVVAQSPGPGMTTLDELSRSDVMEVTTARNDVGPDTIAKILMTSGSTSDPKGVITTQGMMCTNQAQYIGALPFLDSHPPCLVDWLPWNHVFGGSNNFNQVLCHGGSLYIDDGKPIPALIGRTVENLLLKSPTVAYNVPVGFGLLRTEMQNNDALKQAYFRHMDMLFYAGAPLPPDIWSDLDDMARSVRPDGIMMTTCWGMTETAPACIFQHQPAASVGLVGVPLPEVTAKLVPDGPDRYELRVKGPNITPGYFHASAQTEQAFDNEGFFLTGDAMTFADMDDVNAGLKFAGRLSEDFKLATGTWVRASDLRMAVLSALKPLAQDVVLTGEGRDAVGVLILPAPNQIAKADLSPRPGLICSDALQQQIADRLAPFSDPSRGSANRITRALILSEAPMMAAGEITAKGNLNFRKLLTRRAALVDLLYGPWIAEQILLAPA